LLLERLEDRLAPSITHVWSGGSLTSNNWSDPNNWSAGGAPANNEVDAILDFGTGQQQTTNGNDVTGLEVSQLNLMASGYNISGNQIQLGRLASPGSIVSSGTNTLGTPVAIPAGVDATLTTTAAGNSLTLSQAISSDPGNAGLHFVAISGSGTVVFGHDNPNLFGFIDIDRFGTGGVLQVQTAMGLGATGPGNGTFIEAGGALSIEGSFTMAPESITISGAGPTGQGAIEYNGVSTVVMTGTISLLNDSAIGVDGPANHTALLDLSGTAVIDDFGDGRALTKVGQGTLELDAANTYSGGTNVDAGILSITNNSALGLTSAGTVVSAGATLQLAGGLDLNGYALTLNGNGVIDSATGQNAGALELIGTDTTVWENSPFTLGSNASIGVQQGAELNLLVSIDDGGQGRSLTKTLSGTLFLGGSSANTYGGGTFVNDGDLVLFKPAGINAVGSGPVVVGDGLPSSSGGPLEDTAFVDLFNDQQMPSTVNLTVNVDGEFFLNGFTQTVGPLTLNGGDFVLNGGSLILNSNVTATSVPLGAGFEIADIFGAGTISLGGATRTFTVTAAPGQNDPFFEDLEVESTIINGVGPAAGIVKDGTGSMEIEPHDATNTYGGTTTINAGALVAEDGSLGGGLNPLSTGDVTVNSGATLALCHETPNLTLVNNVVLHGFGVSGQGALLNLEAFNTVSGTVTLAADGASVGSDLNTLTLANTVVGPGTFIKVGVGTVALDNVIGTGSPSFGNLYTGGTIVDNGTLLVRRNNALGSNAAGTVVNSGATLEFAGGVNYTTPEPVTINGTGFGGLGAIASGDTPGTQNAFFGPITLNSPSTVEAFNANTFILNGPINNTGNTVTLRALDTSKIIINGTISNPGNVIAPGPGQVILHNPTPPGPGQPIEILPGTEFEFTGPTQLPPTTAFVVDAGGILDLNGFNETIGSLSGTEMVGKPPPLVELGSNTLTTGTDNQNTTFAGVITGTGGLTKVGLGTFTLAGSSSNTYTGPTLLERGMLQFDKTPAITGPPIVAVAGPLIDGDGQIPSGMMLMARDQIASTSPVTVNAASFLDLNGNSNAIASLDLTGGLVMTEAGILGLLGDITSHPSGTTSLISGQLDLGTTAHQFMVEDPPTTRDDFLVTATLMGSGELMKMGPGTLGLRGNSPTFTGTTMIEAGTVMVDGQQPLSKAMVMSGGTLGGIGTTGAITSMGGTVAPGPFAGLGVGILTAAGDSTLNPDSTLAIFINGSGSSAGIDYSQLSVNGAIDLGDARLALTQNPAPSPGLAPGDPPPDSQKVVHGKFIKGHLTSDGKTELLEGDAAKVANAFDKVHYVTSGSFQGQDGNTYDNGVYISINSVFAFLSLTAPAGVIANAPFTITAHVTNTTKLGQDVPVTGVAFSIDGVPITGLPNSISMIGPAGSPIQVFVVDANGMVSVTVPQAPAHTFAVEAEFIQVVTTSNGFRMETVGDPALHYTNSSSVLSTVAVTPGLVVTLANQTAIEGISKGFILGNANDSAGGIPSSATINWGDGFAAPGNLTFDPVHNVFIISASHAYAEEGTYNTASVTVTDNLGFSGSATFTATVSDPAVSVQGGLTFSAAEGATSTTQTLATFTDPGGAEAAGDYSADIAWGDGSRNTGVNVTFSNGIFTVSGSHRYTEEGSYGVAVTVHHDSAPDAGTTSTATVADPMVVAVGGFTLTAVEGIPSTTQTLATFTDPGGAEATGDYSADILWGDGASSTGVGVSSSNGVFTVADSHQYVQPGSYAISVTMHHDSAPDATIGSTATVAMMGKFEVLPPSSPPVPSPVIENVSSSFDLGSFRDARMSVNATPYTATVDWGDGTMQPVPGTFTSPGPIGSLSHTYTEEGPHTVRVTVTDAGNIQASGTFTVTVADAAVVVTGRSINPVTGTEFTGTVATFTDPGGADTTNDSYTASIEWGDGAATSPGTITLSNGTFTVNGSHTYMTDGTFNLTVTVQHNALAPTTSAPVLIAIRSNEFFVQQVYQELLGRPADAEGLKGWVALLNSGTSRMQVALDIEQTAEHRTIQVTNLYQQYLDRTVNSVEINNGVAFLMNGGTVEQFAEALVLSPEFLAKAKADFPGDTDSKAVIERLYLDALKRPVDSAGWMNDMNALNQGTPLKSIVESVFKSDEYLMYLVDRTAQAGEDPPPFNGFYEQFLMRTADPGGKNGFFGLLKQGVRDEVVIADIVGSQEFFNKAQPVM
jgi:autotransporter-associated beta strand protein